MLQADLLIKNVKVFNSAFKHFYDSAVAVRAGRILYVGTQALNQIEAKATVDGGGQYLVPGLIDIHLHIESSMITPPAFSEMLLRNGVTTCVAEPHEIANVFGMDGVLSFLALSQKCAADIFYGIPSSVPSTALETSGGTIGTEDLHRLLQDPRVLCLGEVMDCRTLVQYPDSHIAQMVAAMQRERNMPIIEGHCPRFRGLALARILFCGVDSDHTEQTPQGMRERIANGMFVEIQEKSLTQEIIDFCVKNPVGGHFCFVTDDVMADQLQKGHLNRLVRKAIALGMPPEDAIYAASASPAARMNLRDRGSVAPGKLADFLLLDDLRQFRVKQVYKRGVLVKENKKENKAAGHFFPERFYHSVHLPLRTEKDFLVFTPPGSQAVHCRVIAVQPGTTFTEEQIVRLPATQGRLNWKSNSQLCLGTVFERHHGSGRVGMGLLTGSCLHAGAAATSYAHDHHNLFVVGRDERDMALAANMVIKNGGGICVVRDGKVLELVPLAVGGILSEEPAEQVGRKVACATAALRALGWQHENPIMSLCTVSLPVSPALKLTDRGLVDVQGGHIVPLFLEEE